MTVTSKTLIFIASDRCKGCGLCIAFCPEGVLCLDQKNLNNKGYHPVLITDSEDCIGCGNCAQMCPDYVFSIEKTDH